MSRHPKARDGKDHSALTKILGMQCSVVPSALVVIPVRLVFAVDATASS